jgi:hypothetical protein
MSLTAAELKLVFDAMQSHALAAGLFERVNLHEPKNAPGRGLSAALWVDFIGPGFGSGLAATTVRIAFNLRIYTDMIAEPQDAIDPEILSATATLMEDYSGDFTLGGTIQTVDLLGQSGIPLQAQAGYINQDGKMMRVMTITVPVLISDVWTQTA